MNVTFSAIGRPAPQGSKTYKGRGVMVEASARVRPWRAIVQDAAFGVLGAGWDKTRPMAVDIELVFARPRDQFGVKGLRPTAPKYHVKRKCDIDKGARAILDACTGVLWMDDAQVCKLNVERRYASVPDGEPEQAIVSVTMLDQKG